MERLAGKFDERSEKLDRKMQQLHGQMDSVKSRVSSLKIPNEPKLVPSPRATDSEHTGSFSKKKCDQTTTVDREKALIRPPSFDGTSSWEDYLAQFEVIAELNCWNNCTKASYLAASLHGPAQAVLGDLEPLLRRNFDALTAALENRFGSCNQKEMFHAKLKSRTRQTGETLPELAQCLLRLTRRAFPDAPPEFREMIAKDHFIDALGEVEVRWKVLQTRPKTLHDALTVAVELEAFFTADKKGSRTAMAVHSSMQEDRGKKSEERLMVEQEIKGELRELRGLVSQMMKEQSHQRKGREPVGQSGNEPRCWTCGSMEHFRRDCPKVLRRTGQSQGNGTLLGSWTRARQENQ